ncbi:MAG: hypothetical protein R3A78_03785 [Polyangiales bacterium]|nr:hypothetical protein [Myxococcales bacterium]
MSTNTPSKETLIMTNEHRACLRAVDESPRYGFFEDAQIVEEAAVDAWILEEEIDTSSRGDVERANMVGPRHEYIVLDDSPAGRVLRAEPEGTVGGTVIAVERGAGLGELEIPAPVRRAATRMLHDWRRTGGRGVIVRRAAVPLVLVETKPRSARVWVRVDDCALLEGDSLNSALLTHRFRRLGRRFRQSVGPATVGLPVIFVLMGAMRYLAGSSAGWPTVPGEMLNRSVLAFLIGALMVLFMRRAMASAHRIAVRRQELGLPPNRGAEFGGIDLTDRRQLRVMRIASWVAAGLGVVVLAASAWDAVSPSVLARTLAYVVMAIATLALLVSLGPRTWLGGSLGRIGALWILNEYLRARSGKNEHLRPSDEPLEAF